MQFTYPAVFYYDEEYDDYAVEFSDICIYAEGDTMEDAYKNAQEYLIAYLETCDELKVAPNPPNTYESTLKDHPNGKIMLVTVDYESKHKKLKEQSENKTQKLYASLEDDIVEDIESGFNDGDNPALKRYLENQIKNEYENSETNLNDNDGDDDFGLPEIEWFNIAAVLLLFLIKFCSLLKFYFKLDIIKFW